MIYKSFRTIRPSMIKALYLSELELAFLPYPNTLRNALVKRMASGGLDAPPGIYIISCKDFAKFYTSETSRALKKIIDEHKRDVRQAENQMRVSFTK